MTPTQREEYVQRAIECARLFVQDQLPDTLLALSVGVEPERNHIRLRAHFMSEPSDDDIEAVQITATEVAAQYYDAFLDDDWEVVIPGQEPDFLPSGIAFHRGDLEPNSATP